jgi:hypothetical protein
MRIETNTETLGIIDFVRRDCATFGRGRKKWWANKLGVSQMSLSHWLVGRRTPNAAHLNAVFIAHEELQANNEKKIWTNLLWQNYYEHKDFEPSLLRAIAQKLIKADGLQSRTLALLSWMFAKYPPPDSGQSLNVSRWSNRLGWLYESAGLQSSIEPIEANEVGHLLEISGLDTSAGDHWRAYFEDQQTELGRKWHLYDCPLDDLKEELDWRQ